MYKKPLILLMLPFIGCAFLMGIWISHTTDRDWISYQELVEASQPKKREINSIAKQMREGVLKEVWTQEKPSLYTRIESRDSALSFVNREGYIELVEELQTVRCVTQEKLFYEQGKPMQEVRVFTAKRAWYNYQTQLLVGEDVQIWRYCIEGHEPVLEFDGITPLMSGVAQAVELTFAKEDLDFQAHCLRATFYDHGELL